MTIVLALVLAFIAPIILLPIEHVFNYPYILEEMVKLMCVGLVIRHSGSTKRSYWIFVILIGVLFTISESALYVINFLMDGDLLLLPQRLVLTGLLHSATCVVMYAFAKKGWWLMPVGLTAAIFVHYYFNVIVSTF